MKMIKFILPAVALVLGQLAYAQNPQYRAYVPPELESAHSTAKEELNTIGYMNLPDSIPDSETILQRMELRRNQMRAENRALTPASLGFSVLDEFDRSTAAFPYKTVPANIIRSNSENYILPQTVTIRQLFTKSDFGTLLFEQSVGSLQIDEPNLIIGNHPAKLVISKLRGDKWSTAIFFSDDIYFYRIETDKRLNDRSQSDFVTFAEQIVDSQ